MCSKQHSVERATTCNDLDADILSPASLLGRDLPNRSVVAPMSRVSATGDGRATARMQRYYGDFARGGFGIVITEGTYTDGNASQGYDRQPGIATESQLEAWRPVAQEIRDAGAITIMQLMHAGALSQRGRWTIAPSRVQPLGAMMPEYGGAGVYRLPAAMTLADIQTVRDGFVRAGQRASEAGFDGVEIHAANGYLLDQFNTTYTNRRSDRYGGGPENRIRLTSEIVAAVRGAVPSDFTVGVRVSEAKVNDFEYRWPGGADEATTIFTSLASAGASYIHMAGEGRGFRDALESETEPYTALARRLTGLPVIANGGLGNPHLADEAIQKGYADLVAIGGIALANPDWPKRIEQGAPIVPFSREMLSPRATIENSARWLALRGQTA
ncbi:MAG: NADH:flavin oxidoreductase [Phycisphaerae bacterium]|nr:MAG: NADH:flavin oxidoreductase [Phycisphaerae bacterium]